jgi:hypothetical protein
MSNGVSDVEPWCLFAECLISLIKYIETCFIHLCMYLYYSLPRSTVGLHLYLYLQ